MISASQRRSNRKWAEKNPDKMKAYKRDYYLRNKELVKERAMAWGKANPEKLKEYQQKVYAKNPSKYAFYHKRRQRLKKTNGGTHTFEDWQGLLKEHNNICWGCKKTNVILTEDHKIPLTKGGTDLIENIQPLCKSCNSKKHNTIGYWFLIASE